MFPLDLLLTYLAACLIVVIAPGPDNILAISRGLSQGRAAACLSATGAGLGIMVHALAAALGLSLLIQASPVAFWAVKAVGGVYLLWLGWKALASRNLISFEPSAHQSLRKVFFTGLLSNVLNPKPGLFVLAFLPQFVSASRGPVAVQMLVYGAIFALLTAVIFSVLGCCASILSAWLRRHPRFGTGLNVGAGLTFIASGLSVLALKQRA
ncbi:MULTISPECIES: LysE family translocator [unclassified Variovorax]|uniref:LysE family translocator n=1 Tax=unclassified Variovorax TaxID=663243 RepID=UPI0025765EA8|nr:MULTISPECIES: LysE family translocator [unclassified Variovorax]MDM0090124.1 LysE family translocator [Variovorax sp. J22G40]MDM0148210.1 LysE family translocator [Variovorax sp. J2P1-31]